MEKIKKHRYGLILSQNGTWQAESDTKKKKVIVPIHSNSIRNREFPKNSKTMQKFKENHYGFISGQNGTGWEWYKKNVIVSIHSNQTRNREFQKNSKKIQKIKNTSFWPLFRPKRARTGWEWAKIKSLFRSIPAWPGIQNSKKWAKKFKKTKNIIMAPFQAITGRDRLRAIPKKKSYRSDPFQPDLE